MRQAVILAGGKGTRLRERLGNLPKPLVDICGTPLLERQVLLAKNFGINQVLILVNHAADFIIDYCASRRNWGLDISCIDDGAPRGTAGATLAVFERLADEFLVVYGDTMLNVDIDRFHSYHAQAPEAGVTLLLHPNDHPHDSDLVEVDDAGRIVAFHPYPHDPLHDYPNLVNAALYWMRKSALTPWRAQLGMLDFAKDLFPAMLRSGIVLRGYNSPEYIKDIGTPARLDKVCADFRSGKIERTRLDHPQAMVFIDRDGTINREVNHLHEPAQLELLNGAAEAIRKLNSSEYRACIVSNQPVIARGECTFEGMRAIHNRLETLLGNKGAYVDRIYYCPHHPESGFAGERVELKIDCDCRKPNTGMIDQAMGDFNGARERSWLIGDTTVDMETARRAGLRSILVETGYAGLDGRTRAKPDFIVPNLSSAVAFILDHYPRLSSDCAELARHIGRGAFVFIGGQARCGKTTFANTLRDALHACGKRALVLTLDRWRTNQQAAGAGLIAKFDMDAIQSLVNDLANAQNRPAALSLPGNHKLTGHSEGAEETLTVTPSDIVLVEGVVALALANPATAETHRFHVDIDETARKHRVLRGLRSRGNTDEQSLNLYLAHLQEDVPAIERFAGDAKRISLSSQ